MNFNYKPSKPVAVFSAFIGLGMLIFVLSEFKETNTGFLILWCVTLIGIVALNLWAAFSKNGSISKIEQSEEKNKRK